MLLSSPQPVIAGTVTSGGAVPPPLPNSRRPNPPSIRPQPLKTLVPITRRSILTAVPFLLPYPAIAAVESPPELVPYTDPDAGFTVLKPSSWNQVDKAGATALFVDEKNGANNIGVVVNPVKLSSLTEFGTPEFVAEKLIKAEKKKESTKDAELKSVAERLGHSGIPVYEFEYTVDSTRGGMKRIFSAAFVASNKLHILNIAYSDRPEDPMDNKTRMVLEKILHSFDTA